MNTPLILVHPRVRGEMSTRKTHGASQLSQRVLKRAQVIWVTVIRSEMPLSMLSIMRAHDISYSCVKEYLDAGVDAGFLKCDIKTDRHGNHFSFYSATPAGESWAYRYPVDQKGAEK